MKRRLSLLFLFLGSLVLPAQAPLLGDANADGVVNAADHAFIQAILHRRIPPTAAADVDGDGDVTEADAAAVADLILGQAPFLYQGSGEIAPAGGEVSAGNLNVVAAADALPGPARLVVTAAERPPAFDGDDDSPLYRIDGIPTRYGAGLTVSLPLASPGRRPGREGTVFLEVGEEVFPASKLEPHLALRIVEARVENGRLVADLPPLDVPPPGRADEEIPETQTIVVRRVTGVAVDDSEVLPEEEGGRSGTPARIYHPIKMTKEQYQPVVHALGVANVRLKQLGFSPSDRTRVVEVYIKKLPSAVCGYYVPSGWGVDYSSLEINVSYVVDASRLVELQRTVLHEYFHMIQARFDPRTAFSQTKRVAPTLWFDEACSVWFEKMAPAAQGATSSMLNQHAHEVLAGHHIDSSGFAFLNQTSATKAQNHGYGMALMLEFLFSHPDAPDATRGKANPTLVNIYTAIRNGTEMRQAFLDNVPNIHVPDSWWDKMLAAFVNGTIGNPALIFRSFLTQEGAHATLARLTPDHKGTDALVLGAPSLGDCESWAFSVNWQDVGAKSKRRLLFEIASPDDKLYPRVFGSARNHTNPFIDDGRLFGKYGDSFVSWIAAPMEDTHNGLTLRPLHYLLLRHFGDPPAGKAPHSVRVWHVDTEQPVNTKQYIWPNDDIEPKLITYSLSGRATCEDAFVPYETVLYADAGLTREISRGGASFMVPDGEVQVNVAVTLYADIDPESIYRIKRYRLRLYFHDKAGETREVIKRTYNSPGYATNINETITFGANDAHVFIGVQADEEFKPGAVPKSNVTYSLGSSFNIGTMVRYENALVSRYGAKAGSRQAPTPTIGTYPGIRFRDGVRENLAYEVHPASNPEPEQPALEVP